MKSESHYSLIYNRKATFKLKLQQCKKAKSVMEQPRSKVTRLRQLEEQEELEEQVETENTVSNIEGTVEKSRAEDMPMVLGPKDSNSPRKPKDSGLQRKLGEHLKSLFGTPDEKQD